MADCNHSDSEAARTASSDRNPEAATAFRDLIGHPLPHTPTPAPCPFCGGYSLTWKAASPTRKETSRNFELSAWNAGQRGPSQAQRYWLPSAGTAGQANPRVSLPGRVSSSSAIAFIHARAAARAALSLYRISAKRSTNFESRPSMPASRSNSKMKPTLERTAHAAQL